MATYRVAVTGGTHNVTAALLAVLASAAACNKPSLARVGAAVATLAKVAGAEGKRCNADGGLVSEATGSSERSKAEVRMTAAHVSGAPFVLVAGGDRN